MNSSRQAMENPVEVEAAGDAGRQAPDVITDYRVRRRLKVAAVLAAIMGISLLAAPQVLGYGPLASGVLVIAGVSVTLLAVLFYYFSPAKFLRADVADAMCIAGARFTQEVVSPIAAGSRCIYLPADANNEVRILMSPIDSGLGKDAPGSAEIDEARRQSPGIREISITPPGSGLLEHAKALGAAFTEENLEDELRDVLVSGFELAGKVKVRKRGDSVLVEMRDVASSSMCGKLRKKSPEMCGSIGCPLCSFATCMVVEGTGKRAIIEGADLRGKTIRLSIRLL